MKTNNKSIFLSIFIACLVSSGQVFAEGLENWEVTNFHSNIEILENSDLIIEEKIEADFTYEEHRGIFRAIPLNASPFKNLGITFLSATDENNNPWVTQVFTKTENGDFRINMLRPDNQPTTDSQTFILKYQVKNALSTFSDDPYPHDELYWNINGTDWPVPFKSLSTTITFPTKINPEDVQAICYTGYRGSTDQNCSAKINGNTAEIKTASKLDAYENMTIVLSMPKGTFPNLEETNKLVLFIYNKLGIYLPFATLILLILLWLKKGRDEKAGHSTVMPHYTPPNNLHPAEIGTIIDEKMDPRDITATIIQFAIDGVIEIKETVTKILFIKNYAYELKLLKDYQPKHEFEQLILEGLFEEDIPGETSNMTEIGYRMASKLGRIKKSINWELTECGYFKKNPESVRLWYRILAIVLIFFTFPLGWFFPSFTLILGTMISGAIVLLFSYIMPAKTTKGSDLYYQAKGLYEYINTAEKDRLNFSEKENVFEKLLPYAIAFDLTEKWIKAFEGIVTTPQWFHGSGISSMSDFSGSLSNFSDTASSNFNPGSSGASGGSSGGGGGGGGGGGL